jgi:hypothetical protein
LEYDNSSNLYRNRSRDFEPEITENSEMLTDVTIDISGDFDLENQIQIGMAVEQLGNIAELQPEVWQSLDPGDRVGVLQSVENLMAEIQGRPPLSVVSETLGPGSFGAYDGSTIKINSDQINGNDIGVEEFFDTVVHEGRHAYQQYAIENPGIINNQAIIQAWSANFENYLSAELYGMDIYINQPVEADAWSYATQIRDGIYS